MDVRRSLRTGYLLLAATGVLAAATLSACSSGSDGDADPLAALDALDGGGAASSAPAFRQAGSITIGFSQPGSESGWRAANTKSIQESAADAGIALKFATADGKQEKQIADMRGFIAQKVDVIGFSPVVTSGWEAVLNEAKRAGIPVILTDRAIDFADSSLYATFLGSDFVKEGKEVGAWVAKEYQGKPGPVNVVELRGTEGSAPAKDRADGFREAVDPAGNIKIIASETADFSHEKGKAVMAGLLKAHPKIDVLFAHNDDMALGAIEAIEAAGKKPGTDIKIVSIDGIHAGMEALAAGKINFIAECSPLLGAQLMDLVKKVKAGQPVDKRIVTDETTFGPAEAKVALPNRKY